MIPRYQRILFWLLAGASLVMALVLLRGCEQEHRRLAAHPDTAPLPPPSGESNDPVTLLLANDFEGSLTASDTQLRLPKETTTRARALLNQLLAGYSKPGSSHLLPAPAAGPETTAVAPLEPAVDDVFLLTPGTPANTHSAPPTPGKTGESRQPAAQATHSASLVAPESGTGQIAVVNLNRNFADHHPSGVETETLTLQSIVGTLHANFPLITEVRFLVGGQPSETLAGHANLLRAYPVSDNSLGPTTPVEDDAQP